jgi:hypothetical protein
MVLSEIILCCMTKVARWCAVDGDFFLHSIDAYQCNREIVYHTTLICILCTF